MVGVGKEIGIKLRKGMCIFGTAGVCESKEKVEGWNRGVIKNW